MLRTQIFKYFGLLILLLGVGGALICVQIVRTQISKNTADLWNVLFLYGGLSIAGVLMSFFLAGFLSSIICSPLYTLTEAVNRLRNGQYSGKVVSENLSGETRALIEAFNAMTEELNEKEVRLSAGNEELKSKNKSYMDTLGFISHELKTPLGSILNYSYLLGQQRLGDMNEKQLSAVKNIDANTRRITEMVRLYLNLSRVENKELNPRSSVVDVNQDIVVPLLETFDAALKERRISVVNEIRKNLCCLADLNLATEIFENLIGNAIKYGDDNGIITLKAVNQEKLIEFSIRNTGQGIPPEYREMIFEKFTRIEDRPLGRQVKGTGLGLFITRHIVNAHGGTIRVESKEGEWTEFVFTLPVGDKERVESYA
ncbi:MAG: HAMP domain-containing histidine kinase [Fibrobacter sp.]|nr:HAMP domain-containing histidine kinase [Fibrobacter sp.]